MELRKYNEIRHIIKPGDIMAFGGKGLVSGTIKTVTRSPVSHVGTILSVQACAGVPLVMLAESTSLDDEFSGVRFVRMSDVIRDYDGDIWWLPLAPGTRVELNERAFVDFVVAQEGKPYDAKQAMGSALDYLDLIFSNKEDISKLFCSEYVTAAFEVGFEGSDVDCFQNVNASEKTPADVVKFPVYHGIYQLKGEEKEV